MDVLIYMGVTVIRREKLSRMEAATENERNQTVAAHNKWLDIVANLYKSVQFERNLFKDTAGKMGLGAPEDLEERLLKQQNLIKGSWKLSG